MSSHNFRICALIITAVRAAELKQQTCPTSDSFPALVLQIGPRAAVQVLPPRRPPDEHQLAGVGSSQRQRHAAHDRAGRQQDLPQTAALETRVPAGEEHDPDHGHRLLLREYTDLQN